MKNNQLEIANATLLAPAELSHDKLEQLLGTLMLGRSIDYADFYFQSARQESWVLEDSLIKNGSYNVDYGVGVRAISGEKTGFAYSDEIVLPALEKAANAAKTIAAQGGDNKIQAWQSRGTPLELYGVDNPLKSIPDAEKILLLRDIDAQARKMDPRVSQVIVNLAASHEVVLVVTSDGTLSADVRPLVRLSVNVIAEEKGRREQGSSGGGGRFSYTQFLQENLHSEYVRTAVNQALINLRAIPAPAGTMPVVLGPGWPGVMLHEAVGHGLEGDFNRKGCSAFSGRIGERVASPVCTVVDDGTIANRRGSLNMDDEGTQTERTVLIENGILKGYLQDKLNARLMGVSSTGNGRRESYSHVVIPRMTNTFMLAGNQTPEEIIASVDKGLYAVNFGGGQVDITSGKFVFNASEAYLIEKGKITQPVKGATLVGNGPEILKHVTMVGNDLKLDSGIGTCGKEGQSVPVGVGQPTLKIDQLTVGGTKC